MSARPRQALRVAAVLAPLGLLALAPASAAAATAARALPPAGNWETVGAGTGSFQLVVRHSGLRGVASIEDAVFTLPERCNDRPGTAPLIVRRPTVRIARDGRFARRWIVNSPVADTVDTFAGRIHGQTATVSTRFEQTGPKYGGGSETCDTGTVTLTLEPSPRVPVRDGDYVGQAQNGEAIGLHVVAGGRLLDMKKLPPPAGLAPSFSVGTWTTDCSSGSGWCQSSGSDGCARQVFATAFITPQGTLTLPGGPGMPAVGVRFGGGGATGTLTYPSDLACSTAWTAAPAP